jgi:malonyl-CoA/methylmalonyl-CoA synthetase
VLRVAIDGARRRHSPSAPSTAAGGLYAAIAASLARRHADVTLEAGTRQLTGERLASDVECFAAALASLGVHKGDRVAVQTGKSLDQVLLYLASLRIGAVYVPLNTGYLADEVRYFLGDAEPRLFVCDPAREAAGRPLAEAAGSRIATLGTNSDGSLLDAVAESSGTAPPTSLTDADLAAIVYTSGTTGRSKGAMITHGNLSSNAHALISTWQIGASDVLLHALPLFHIHGLFVALNTLLLAGGRVRLLPSFEPAAVLAGFARASLFMGVPTYYTRLLATPGLDRSSTAGIRLFICGSAPLLPQTMADFEARTGHQVVERYGMSECGIICSNPVHGPRVPGTVGRPLPGVELRIVTDTGAPVVKGAPGVIEVRGPGVFSGYWRMPAKTAGEFKGDGFFVTGDIGREDDHGYIHIVGRTKDMIISGGLNVYPKEVELMLDTLPGVAESAVIGLPHPDFGEAVVALVCASRAAPPPNAEALLAESRRRLAAFKAPKAIFIVDELPRNAMGKVQKTELRQRYSDTFGTR